MEFPEPKHKDVGFSIDTLRKMGYQVFAADGKLRLYWDSGNRRPDPEQVIPHVELLRRGQAKTLRLLGHQQEQKKKVSFGRKKKRRRKQKQKPVPKPEAKKPALDLRSMPYEEYLQTEHWQGVRDRALAYAENKCQVCYDWKLLNVHHRTYTRRGNERPADVIVLCRECHEIFHAHGKLGGTRGPPSGAHPHDHAAIIKQQGVEATAGKRSRDDPRSSGALGQAGQSREWRTRGKNPTSSGNEATNALTRDHPSASIVPPGGDDILKVG